MRFHFLRQKHFKSMLAKQKVMTRFFKKQDGDEGRALLEFHFCAGALSIANEVGRLVRCGALRAVLCALLSLIVNVQAQTLRQSEAAAASISGRVTISGKPAVHAFVSIKPYDAAATDSKLPGTSTDGEGNYHLSDVPEGRFEIGVIAPAFIPVEAPGADQSGSRLINSVNGSASFILSVARGDVISGINFELTRGGVITGRVTDAGNKPVVGAWVSCAQVNQGVSFTSYGKESDTDDRGVYRIYGLPAGKYVVFINNGIWGRRYPQTFHPNVTARGRATPVEVSSDSESTDIDISLGQPEKSYSIRGRVRDGSTGRLIPNINLSFRGLDGVAAGTEGFVSTDSEGKFEMKGYSPSHYQIQVTFTGSPNQGYYSDPLRFEVADADVTEVELQGTRGATISGAVAIEGSNDLSLMGRLSALVAEQVPSPGSDMVGGRPAFVSTMISPGGSFEFRGVRPGRTKIDVVLPEGFSLIRIERAGVPVTDGIDISPGEQVTGVRVVLAYGTGSIRGQAKVTGGNLPGRFGWQLEVRRAGGERIHFEQPDATGLFWIKGLSPGSYEVTVTIDYAEVPGVTPSKYPAPLKQAVTVENGAESRVSFALDLSKTEKN